LAIAALVALAVAVFPLHSTERPAQAPTPTPTATPSAAVSKAAKVVYRNASTGTAHLHACTFVTRAAKLRLVDGTPLPAITAALPALATASGDPAALLKRLPAVDGGPVLRQTLRELTFPGGVVVQVFVVRGRTEHVADPEACGQARAAQIAARATGAVRAAALALLASDPVVSPEAQTLQVMYGTGGPVGGVGIPLAPGRHVPLGVLGYGGPAGARLIVGIADPRAVAVRSGGVTIKVRDGLYAFRTPPERVFEELAADGSVLRRDRVR
jgi:hypothetical protein